MIGRRRQLASDVAEYKESLVLAKDRKRSIQADNAAFWQMQQRWQKEREAQQNSNEPKEEWTIEDPGREIKREEWCTKAYKELKETLDSQTAEIKKKQAIERERDSLIVKNMIETDAA